MSHQKVNTRQFQFEFDEILVAKENEAPKAVFPPVLFFTRKYVYTGTNGNWRLTFKDLNAVERSTIGRDADDDDSYQRGGRGGRGPSRSETSVLSLVGRRMSLKCSARAGGRTAGAARDLESFLDKLGDAHRRAKAKADDKDHYAFEDEDGGAKGAHRGHSRPETWSAGGTKGRTYGNGRRKGGKEGAPSRVVVTPAPRTMHLSPTKKRMSAGAFQSPSRGRGGSGRRDRTRSPARSPARSPSGPGLEGDGAATVGNVVREPESPAPRRLDLPPKSPHNATPARLRPPSTPGEGGETRRVRSIASQLQGISGGNIKLRKRVDEEMIADFDEDEYSVEDQKRTNRKQMEQGEEEETKKRRNGKLEEQGEEEGGASSHEGNESRDAEKESSSPEERDKSREVPKRRRLQRTGEKTNKDNEDGSHSDVEFDDNPSSCKKKLQLSIEDDSDEEEEDEAEAIPAKETSREEVPQSPSPLSPEAAAPEEPPESTAEVAPAPSPAKKKKTPANKASIANFFTLPSNPSGCKKKLQLPIGDDSDDEEAQETSEEEVPEPSSPLSSETAAPEEPPSSTAEVAPAASPANKKKMPANKASIANFFALPSNPSSCKKKLQLTIGDNSDAKEAPETPMEEVPEPSSPLSPVTTAPEEPPESTAEVALAPSPAKKKKMPTNKASIANFFALPSKSTAKKEATKRPAPPDAHGAAPSTPPPPKKICSDSRTPKTSNTKSLPTTPPTRTDRLASSPAARQTHRRSGASRYFSGVSNVDGADSERSVSGGDALTYSSGEEGRREDDAPPDYEDDGTSYYDGTEDAARRKNACAETQSQRKRGTYGRVSRLGRSRLAQPRLTSHLRDRPPPVSRSHKSPVSRLDFNGCRAAPAGRGIDFSAAASLPHSAADLALGGIDFCAAASLPHSAADLALGRKRDATPPLVPTEDDGGERPRPKVAAFVPGIQNLGNTCYLSASLQTLFSVPRFVSDLYNTYESQSAAGKEMPLTRALLEAAAAVGALPEKGTPSISPEAARSGGAGDPAALKGRMDELTGKFAGYEQRDAHEFLSDLVDFLHDELAANPAAGAPAGEGTAASADGDGDPAGAVARGDGDAVMGDDAAAAAPHGRRALPTDKYFRLDVRVRLECDSCGYSRSKDEMYRHLSVDVGEDSELDKCTVERGLERFFQPETRELKCEKCQCGKTATQTMKIISCPKVLLLHFKRFLVTQEIKASINVGDKPDGKENNVSPPPRMEMVLRKNKAKIPLEESLSINPFVSKNEESPPGKYHLRGVVHHVGGTAFSGHYTTCAKRMITPGQGGNDEKKSDNANVNARPDNKEQWVFFDDRVGVEKNMDYVTGSERNQRNCYMALYELG